MTVEFNQVGWFEIPVTDLKRSMDFYQSTFGIKLEEHDMGSMKTAWFPMKMNEWGRPG